MMSLLEHGSAQPLSVLSWETEKSPLYPVISGSAASRSYCRIKRVLDVAAAASLLLLLWPVFLLIALAVFAEDRGPVFFFQMRVGRDGREFRFYKFRSMVRHAEAAKAQLAARNEADGPNFKMKKDPRITRVGRWIRKYSLDELPQLVNVLKGNMSLVGPRPHLPSEVACYNEDQRSRLSVPPGLVCLREVSGRSNLTFDRWVELDLIYIAHRSFATDLRILLCVIPAVLHGEGAY